MKDVLIVENIQMCILASVNGMKDLYGFEFENMDRLDKKCVYEAVHRMIRKGLLFHEGEELKVNKDIAVMLDIIKNATSILVVRTKDSRRPTLCCYLKEEQAIVSQVSWADEASYRLSMMKNTDLYEFLLENEYAPLSALSDDMIYSDDSNDISRIKETEIVKLLLEGAKADDDNRYTQELFEGQDVGEIYTYIEPATGKVQKRICTLKYELKDVILAIERSIECDVFSRTSFREYLGL